MSRDGWAAIAASAAVVVVVVLGFRMLGSPANQRLIQSDLRVVQSLANLARQIQFRWNNSQKVLPATLDTIPTSAKENPVTHEGFLYHAKSTSEYELCATFATDNRDGQTPDASNRWDTARWAHPRGQYCFQLDASQPVPQAPYVY
jgi:hypothetical protein